MTDNTTIAALLPCPFCGSTDIQLHGVIGYDGRWAVCEDCGCTMSEVATLNDQQAVARWNRRFDGQKPAGDAVLKTEPAYVTDEHGNRFAVTPKHNAAEWLGVPPLQASAPDGKGANSLPAQAQGLLTGVTPTEPGYYWFGDDVVQVFTRPGHSYLCIAGEPYGPSGKRDFVAIAQMPASKWSARIKRPDAPALNKEASCGEVTDAMVEAARLAFNKIECKRSWNCITEGSEALRAAVEAAMRVGLERAGPSKPTETPSVEEN